MPSDWNYTLYRKDRPDGYGGVMIAIFKTGVNRAVLEFGIPCTTLKDRVAGRIAHGSNMGPNLILIMKKKRS